MKIQPNQILNSALQSPFAKSAFSQANEMVKGKWTVRRAAKWALGGVAVLAIARDPLGTMNAASSATKTVWTTAKTVPAVTQEAFNAALVFLGLVENGMKTANAIANSTAFKRGAAHALVAVVASRALETIIKAFPSMQPSAFFSSIGLPIGTAVLVDTCRQNPEHCYNATKLVGKYPDAFLSMSAIVAGTFLIQEQPATEQAIVDGMASRYNVINRAVPAIAAALAGTLGAAATRQIDGLPNAQAVYARAQRFSSLLISAGTLGTLGTAYALTKESDCASDPKKCFNSLTQSTGDNPIFSAFVTALGLHTTYHLFFATHATRGWIQKAIYGTGTIVTGAATAGAIASLCANTMEAVSDVFNYMAGRKS